MKTNNGRADSKKPKQDNLAESIVAHFESVDKAVQPKIIYGSPDPAGDSAQVCEEFSRKR